MSGLICRDESYAIRGAVFEVYREMGSGYLEAVYQECLQREFIKAKIDAVSQPLLHLNYKGERLMQTYRPDFICYKKIIVEIKAVKDLSDNHRSQLINYLKSTGIKLGFLVNFGSYPKAVVERFVL